MFRTALTAEDSEHAEKILTQTGLPDSSENGNEDRAIPCGIAFIHGACRNREAS